MIYWWILTSFICLLKIAFFFFLWELPFHLAQFSLMFRVSYGFVKAPYLLLVLQIFSLSIFFCSKVVCGIFKRHAFNFYVVVCFQAATFINNSSSLYLYNTPHVPGNILNALQILIFLAHITTKWVSIVIILSLSL